MNNMLSGLHRRGNFSLLLLIVLLSLLLGFYLVNNESMFYFFLIVIMIVFIFLKPIIGIYLALIFDLWFSGIKFLGANPRTYIAGVLISIMVISYILLKRGKVYASPLKKIFYPAIAFIVWVLVVNLFIAKAEIPASLRNASTFITRFSFCFLIPYFVDQERKLKSLLFFLLFILSISSFIGIAQVIIGGPFYSIRSFFGKIPFDFTWHNRAVGISLGPIDLSYQLLAGSIIAVAMFVSFESSNFFEKVFIGISSLLIGIGLLFSYTRTAIAGSLISILVMFILFWKVKRKFKFERVLMPILAIFFVVGLVLNASNLIPYKLTNLGGPSLEGRIPLFETALRIIKGNPLGTGITYYKEKAEEKYYYVKDTYEDARIVLLTTAHNHFLLIAGYYGIIGLLIFLIFLKKTFQASVLFYKRSTDYLLRGLSIGFLAYECGYIFHFFFHNAGPFKGDIIFWYILGMMLSGLNISLRLGQNKKIS